VPSLGVPAGAVGLLVRLADPAAAAVLRPGSRVDLLPGPGGAALRDILVLAVVAGGLFDEPGAAALLVAVPADHGPADHGPADHGPAAPGPAGRMPAGPEATRVTYEVIVRTG
jgi:hypothetical protein